MSHLEHFIDNEGKVAWKEVKDEQSELLLAKPHEPKKESLFAKKK